MVALRAHFAGARAENDQMIKYHMHAAGSIIRGISERVQQVVARIGVAQGNALLRAGNDNGLAVVLDQIRKRRRCIGHGIRPVGDDKAVILVVVIAYAARHLKPVVGGDVRAVKIHQLYGVTFADIRQLRNERHEVLAFQLRCQARAAVQRGNRAAGRNEKNVFHVHSSL